MPLAFAALPRRLIGMPPGLAADLKFHEVDVPPDQPELAHERLDALPLGFGQPGIPVVIRGGRGDLADIGHLAWMVSDIIPTGEIDGNERFNEPHLGPRPVALHISPADAVRIGPYRVGTNINMLRRGTTEVADAQLGRGTRDGPHRAWFALVRWPHQRLTGRVDEIEHVRVNRAERQQPGLFARIAADQPPQEIGFPAQRRVVEIDDQ